MEGCDFVAQLRWGYAVGEVGGDGGEQVASVEGMAEGLEPVGGVGQVAGFPVVGDFHEAAFG